MKLDFAFQVGARRKNSFRAIIIHRNEITDLGGVRLRSIFRIFGHSYQETIKREGGQA